MAAELPILGRLKKELDKLKYELTFELPKALQEAAAHGDLSENAEYEAAKHRQDFVRSRIGQIEGRIRELSMYTIASIPQGVVAYGSRVTVEDIDAGEAARLRDRLPRGGRRRAGPDLPVVAARTRAAEQGRG